MVRNMKVKVNMKNRKMRPAFERRDASLQERSMSADAKGDAEK